MYRMNRRRSCFAKRHSLTRRPYAPLHRCPIRPVALTVAHIVAAVMENDRKAAAREIHSRAPSSSRYANEISMMTSAGMMWLNGNGQIRVAAKSRTIRPTSRFVVWNGVCKRGRISASTRLSSGMVRVPKDVSGRDTSVREKTREIRRFAPYDHLGCGKRQQDADEYSYPRHQADQRQEKHDESE